jgi:predicted NAD-dependent protein-ADP-ribosyltransferase YbiA (DUF1768 family)
MDQPTIKLSDFEYHVLSHHSTIPLFWKGIQFDTLLHAFYWEMFTKGPPKVAAVELQVIQDLILKAPTSKHACDVAHRYKAHRHPHWDIVDNSGLFVRNSVLLILIEAKRKQYKYVREKLKHTGDALITDDTWDDSYWGTGKDGQGENVSGQSLVFVRDFMGGKVTRPTFPM